MRFLRFICYWDMRGFFLVGRGLPFLEIYVKKGRLKWKREDQFEAIKQTSQNCFSTSLLLEKDSKDKSWSALNFLMGILIIK